MSYGADMLKILKDPGDLDLWLFDPEMVRDTLPTHVLCMKQIHWICMELWSGHAKNFKRRMWPGYSKLYKHSKICNFQKSKIHNTSCGIVEYVYQIWRELVEWLWSYYAPDTKKHIFDLCDLDLRPFDLKLCIPQAFHQMNICCKYNEDQMKGTWRKGRDRHTGTHTDICLMQLKMSNLTFDLEWPWPWPSVVQVIHTYLMAFFWVDTMNIDWKRLLWRLFWSRYNAYSLKYGQKGRFDLYP